MTGSVCKARKAIIKGKKRMKLHISDNISDLKDSIFQSGEQSIKDLKNGKKSTISSFKKSKEKLKNMYLGQKWRKKRPDMTLFMELLLVIILAITLYYIWPWITASVKPSFTPEQFNKASQMSPTSFSMEEISKVNIEAASFRNYATYFTSDPFSDTNKGISALNAGAAVLPFVSFFIMFVLPPFTLGYVIWFIVKFIKHVYKALWGWFIMLYKYFTRLIQGKMGCKWYIRMVTGWGCNSPRFGQYFKSWRRRYVDVPAYYEKLNYIRKYNWAKKHYYEIPFYNYITIPTKRYKVKSQFAKKLYVDRAVEVFLKKLRNKYPQYYTMPKAEFLKWLIGNNRELAGVYAKAMQAKAQVSGRSYRSVDNHGKQCTCPGSKTPLKMMKKETKGIKHNIDSLIKATNKVYDKVTSVSDSPTCGSVDRALEKPIKNRHDIARKILILIVLIILALFIYSSLYSTPAWLKNMTSTATGYVSRGSTLNLSPTPGIGVSLPVIYLTALSSMMFAVLFT
jgi:hypothetical protein